MSNKYKLIKELPFAEIGSEVFISNGLCVETKDKLVRRIDTLPVNYGETLADEIQRLIKEGWIEEIKPEVIYIWKALRGPNYPPEYHLYLNKEEAELDKSKDTRSIGKISKFIEVIE